MRHSAYRIRCDSVAGMDILFVLARLLRDSDNILTRAPSDPRVFYARTGLAVRGV
jgi:hypothetical protein